MCHCLATILSLAVVDVLAGSHTRTGVWGVWNTDLRGRPAGSTCKAARIGRQVSCSPLISVPDVFSVLRGVAGRDSPFSGCPPLASLPPVAQGSFQAAQGRVDEAVALVVGAAGAHPAQAGVVEEAEVAP